MKLILGTANFGRIYGVANGFIEISNQSCHQILDLANSSGIEFLDTAKNYGDSESIIGKYHINSKKFKVYSKSSLFERMDSKVLQSHIRDTNEKLKIEKLAGFYFHDSQVLHNFSIKKTNIAIDALLDSGLVEKIGVSIYDENELNWITTHFPRIRLFQVPENILDRRLLNSELVRELKHNGIEFHIRSIFLQGLLLMEMNSIPSNLRKAVPAIEQLQIFSKRIGKSMLETCLSYLSLTNWASSCVIGVANRNQLAEILKSNCTSLYEEELPNPLPHIILDPRKWSKS